MYPYIHNSLSEKESNITNYVKPVMRHLFSSRSRIISTSQVSTSKTGQTLVPCISTYLLSLLDKRLDKFPVTACSRYPGKMERIVSPSVAHTSVEPRRPESISLTTGVSRSSQMRCGFIIGQDTAFADAPESSNIFTDPDSATCGKGSQAIWTLPVGVAPGLDMGGTVLRYIHHTAFDLITYHAYPLTDRD